MFWFLLTFIVLALGQQEKTLEQALKDCSECSDAVQNLFTSDFLKTLGDKPATLLVPNKEAIMQEDTLKMMPQEEKVKLAKFHVISETLRQLKDGNITGLEGNHTVKKEGESFKIDDKAKVIGEYRAAKNGQGFYVIDKVLAPKVTDEKSEDTRATLSTLPRQPRQSVWQLIQADPQLSLIQQLIQQNPQIRQLLTGPLTFFLPNDAAVTQIQQMLSQLQGESLVDFIRNHVVYGHIPELQDKVRLATLLPKTDLDIKRVGDKFTVNDANVIGNYHRGANRQGYYLIDKVLVPDVSSQNQGSGQGIGRAPPGTVQPGMVQPSQ